MSSRRDSTSLIHCDTLTSFWRPPGSQQGRRSAPAEPQSLPRPFVGLNMQSVCQLPPRRDNACVSKGRMVVSKAFASRDRRSRRRSCHQRQGERKGERKSYSRNSTPYPSTSWQSSAEFDQRQSLTRLRSKNSLSASREQV